MRYLLDERYTAEGWKLLPFALRDNETKKVAFMDEAKFRFIMKCSGKHDIDIGAQPEDVRSFAEELLKLKVVLPVDDGRTRNIFYRRYPGMFKQNVQWSITGKCNYRCRHCFQSAPKGVLGEPSLEQCFDIIRQFDENGIRRIDLTGGEPLIRGDFFDIVDEILRRDMLVTTIYSNGRLITREFLEKLKERKIQCGFQISFDGIGWHDWMRGVPGSEEKAFEAFALLREYGFMFSSAMCLCRENAPAIRDTVNALAKEGCIFLKLQCASPEGEWCDQKEHYLTDEEALQLYLDYLPVFHDDGCPMPIQMEGFFIYNKERGTYSCPTEKKADEKELNIIPLCGVIHSSLFVGPNGAVVPCMSMNGLEIEKRFPNIFEMPLSRILSDSGYYEITNKRVDYFLENRPECKNCPHRCDCCGGCRAMAVLDYPDDYFAPSKLACKMFRDGWIDRLHEVAGRYWKNAAALPPQNGDDAKSNVVC